MPIRPDSTIIDIYNDGTMVYLYDESFRGRLLEMNAVPLILGTDARDDADALRKSLVNDKLLVAYELMGDDEVRPEISVGQPLTTKEKKGRKWLKLQKSRIDLPSGQLRVESANSCSIQKDEPGDEGQTVSVPPGEYLLSLLRADVDVDDDGGDDDEHVVSEVVVLTPIAEAKAPKKWDPFLTWEQASGVAPLRLPAPEIRDGAFHGSAMNHYSWNYTNLDQQSLRKMGIRFGDQVDLEIGGQTLRALYSGTLSAHGVLGYFNVGPLVQDDLPPVLAGLMYHDSQRKIVFELKNWHGESLQLSEDPVPIVIRKAEPPLLPQADESLLGTAERLPNAQVRAPILLSASHGVLIDLDAKALKHLKIQYGGRLSVTYKDLTREVYLSNTILMERDKLVQKIEKIAPENNDRVKELQQEEKKLYGQIEKTTDMDERNAIWLERESKLRELERLRVPPELHTTLPLYGNLSSYFEDADRGVLWITPLIGGEFFMEFTRGDTVLLHDAKK